MPASDIYAHIFENARTGLLLLNRATGSVREANAAFLRMAARGCDEVVGRNFWEPPLIADAQAGAEIHAHLRAGGAAESVELPLEAGDGRWRVLEVSGTPAGDFIQLEVQDATGREQARLAERMEALRLSAGRTSGEFQSLHRTLRMMGELLLVNVNRDRPVLRVLEEVQQAAERADAIAGQLLAFSGRATVQIRRVALNDLIQSLLPRLRQLFGQGIEIVCDLSPDLEPVSADPAQVRHIILQLAANSREAMGRAGTFCLQTRNAPADEAGMENTENGTGFYAMLATSDNGPGLDDDSWAHLFEPFSSTKANRAGLGLGLAAVYGIVKQSGGRVWAYSQPGKGTTFRIYFPQAKSYFPALPAPQTTILLIEAHDGLRSQMANLLRRCGYYVLMARDPREALRVAASQGLPDLLIGPSQPDLVQDLARVQPHLRVLVLRKPFEPKTLLAAVQESLEHPF
jgi:signal transduction histidine kinase